MSIYGCKNSYARTVKRLLSSRKVGGRVELAEAQLAVVHPFLQLRLAHACRGRTALVGCGRLEQGLNVQAVRVVASAAHARSSVLGSTQSALHCARSAAVALR